MARRKEHYYAVDKSSIIITYIAADHLREVAVGEGKFFEDQSLHAFLEGFFPCLCEERVFSIDPRQFPLLSRRKIPHLERIR